MPGFIRAPFGKNFQASRAIFQKGGSKEKRNIELSAFLARHGENLFDRVNTFVLSQHCTYLGNPPSHFSAVQIPRKIVRTVGICRTLRLIAVLPLICRLGFRSHRHGDPANPSAPSSNSGGGGHHQFFFGGGGGGGGGGGLMPFSFGRRARRSSRGKSDFQVKSSGGGKEAFFRFHSFYYVNTLAYIFMKGSCT